MKSTRKIPQTLAGYIWQHCKPYWMHILIALGVAFVDSLSPVGVSYLVKVIVDRVSTTSQDSLFSILFWPVIFFLILELSLEVVWRLYGYFIQVRFQPALRRSVLRESFPTILNKSYEFHQSHQAGDLAHSLIRLSEVLPMVLRYIHEFFMGFLLVIMGLYTLYQVSLGFSLFLGAWVFVLLLVVMVFNRFVVRQTKVLSAKEMKVYGGVLDTLRNMFAVNLFSHRSFEEQKVGDIVEDTVQADQRVAKTYFWIFFFLSTAYLAFQVSSLIWLIRLRQLGQVTTGDFALVLGLNNMVAGMLWARVRQVPEFTVLLGECRQALDVVTSYGDREEVPNAKALEVKKGDIVFQGVGFTYNESEQMTLENFSLTIPGGQKVGFVGASGVGKSTCIKLLLRLYDVDKGVILIDGQDIAQVTEDSLRKQVGVVPQHPILFHTSVGDNIRYGDLAASREEVIEAAKKAHAHEFIMKMNEGYAAEVGEGGDRLSGGQRQRVAMARAILKDAPILVLDEATSQLDAVTEKYIQDSLDTLMEGKTVLVIAHRLATLEKLDRIIVIDEGQVVEDGTHDDLLKREGIYYKLWHTQHHGFLGTTE